MLQERLFQILLDLVMYWQFAERIRFRFLKNMVRTLSTQHVGDQHAVIAIDERIERQSLLFLELHYIDRLPATRTSIAVMQPPTLNGAAKLHLRLAEELV